MTAMKREWSLGVLCILLLAVSMHPGNTELRASRTALEPESVGTLAQATVEVDGDVLIMEGTSIRVRFDLASRGNLISVKNIITGQSLEFLGEPSQPFWMIVLMEWEQKLADDSTSFEYMIDSVGATFAYSIPMAIGMMNATLRLQIDDPYPGLNFNINVDCLESHSGLRQVYLPYMGGLAGWGGFGNEEIAIPEREGWLITDAIESIQNHGFARSYPGTLSMQFLVLSAPDRGGFVVSAFDSKSRHKGIGLDRDYVNMQAIRMDWWHFSDNMKYERGNNFTMDYWMVLDGYEGQSWAEGASIYRDWAVNQWYVEKGPVASREDVPQWLKDIDYIWKGSSYATDHNTGNIITEGTPVDRMGDLARMLVSKGLSNNCLIEWWGWNRDGFDRGYPEYFPARDGNETLRNGINDAQSESFHVMLYFNGRLVDRETETYNENNQHLTGYKDSIYHETYNPYFTAAIADPSSQWWQDLMSSLCLAAVDDFNVDVIYLDQISVASPKFDYRNVTTHPPGTGSWWQEAQNQLLFRIQDEIGAITPDAALSSENVLETYLRNIDIFWAYQTSYEFAGWFPDGVAIPMFSYVYHKYALISGRPDVAPETLTSFVWATSEVLKNGYVPGASSLSLLSGSWISLQSYAILKAAYETRMIGDYKFFRDGDLLLPVEWDGNPDITISDWETSITVPQGAIQGYLSSDGDVAFLFANRGDTSLQYTGSLTDLLEQAGVNLQYTDSMMCYENGVNNGIITSTADSITIDVPRYGFVVLWMNADGFTEIFSIDTTPPIPTEIIVILVFTALTLSFIALIAIREARNES
ncbi:MAG: DUF6259 domain-containing protein [Candidatus Thorarchaeota archaeon]|jgi:hypothetical protein